MLGWSTGILGVFFSWLTLNFLGKPYLEFRKVLQEIQEELVYLSDVDPPSQELIYDGEEEDLKEAIRIFADAQQIMKRLGAKVNAISIDLPLSYMLRLFGYDLDKAAKDLLRLSIHSEHDERTITRYNVESALQLPHANEWWAKRLIEDRKRKQEAAKRRKASAGQSA